LVLSNLDSEQRFEVILQAHFAAARHSRMLPKAAFVELGLSMYELRMTNPERDPAADSRRFATLLHQILISAAGNYRQFKEPASCGYVLDEVYFYSNLESCCSCPNELLVPQEYFSQKLGLPSFPDEPIDN
jgi:hypothetical protein